MLAHFIHSFVHWFPFLVLFAFAFSYSLGLLSSTSITIDIITHLTSHQSIISLAFSIPRPPNRFPFPLPPQRLFDITAETGPPQLPPLVPKYPKLYSSPTPQAFKPSPFSPPRHVPLVPGPLSNPAALLKLFYRTALRLNASYSARLRRVVPADVAPRESQQQRQHCRVRRLVGGVVESLSRLRR